MMYLYSGTPGSGKSLHVAKKIRDCVRLHRPVIGNFPVFLPANFDSSYYTFISNDKLDPKDLVRFSREYFKNHRFSEGTITLIIDECQILFNAREWQQSGRAEWLSFFTQHRHFGFNIILVAQFDRMIDRQIRSLLEYEYIHRKVKNIGFGGFLFSLFAGGNLFICVERWYPLHEKVGTSFFRAKKKLYSIYDSYGVFGSALGTGDMGPRQPAPQPAPRKLPKIKWPFSNVSDQIISWHNFFISY